MISRAIQPHCRIFFESSEPRKEMTSAAVQSRGLHTQGLPRIY
jgi:hypothetical protein